MKFPITLLLSLVAACGARAQRLDYEEEPHNYWSAPVSDTCTDLDKALANGALKLTLSDGKTMVRQVLDSLKVPAESQVLVFSKTSLQRDRISPSRPRALYFNDECYVGWVPGGLVEFAGMDPHLGPVFYSLNPERMDRAVPRLDRSDECINCHAGSMTNRVPGLMLRSVYPDSDGSLLLQMGTSLIDHTSPISERWGGWYVTGTHGSVEHMGNVTATRDKDGNITLDRKKGANVKSLAPYFDTSRYLRDDSDIVALMTMEHQVAMHSRLVEAAYDVRMAISRQTSLRKELGEPATEELVGSTKVVAASHCEKVLKCLLFCEEAAMPDGGVDGGPAFQDAFRSNRRASKEGKSLKDFQLLTRLFKYRCSYLIYSRSWEALPQKFRDVLYRRLFDILTATTPVKGYEHLSAGERREILEILRDTKQGLPAYWKE
ncbi:MAG TPA: hypothetical protein VHM91_09795 [Verrucomicrobiales bacterium]|jgi:hypothetical protein|nr:hypothetical protein [Verrucomicrobiales bacterium]